jgi:hypothetical protein
MSALHYAVLQSIEVVKVSLEYGADIDMENKVNHNNFWNNYIAYLLVSYKSSMVTLLFD